MAIKQIGVHFSNGKVRLKDGGIGVSMSTNISKEKREKLVEKIKAIKTYIATAPQDENTVQLLTYIAEIEKDIKGKKYGLVFEEHREQIDEVLETNTPVLTEEKDLFIDNGGQMNFLIEGDNLASLQLLEKTHKGKIDLIYIDPPYNTGNKDFVYDDVFVDSNDTFRHSKWLSFMEKRLSIAKTLLSERGVIFISIDYNEDSQLTLLLNEIFGETNFIAKITREAIKGGSKSKLIRNVNDYVICFAKNIDMAEFGGYVKDAEELTLVDEHGPYLKGRELNKWGAGSRREDSPTMYFPIQGPNNEDVYPIRNDGSDGRWRLGKKKMFEKVAAGDVIFEKRENGTYIVYEKIRETHEKIKQFTTLFLNNYLNAKGGESIKKLFNTMMSIFDYAKPVELIYDLLVMGSTKKDFTVLDFFAGSGTTAHAVMRFNKDFDKNIKFILATNNQNNICRDITYERIKLAMLNENSQISLKYFKVDFVPITDKLYYEYADELLLHIRELVELENGINFNDNDEIAIILTETELDGFMENIPDGCKSIYLGHDVLPNEKQESLFKKYNIAVNIIPDYYYRDLEG